MPSYVRPAQWSRLTPAAAVNKQVHKEDRAERGAMAKAEMWWRFYMRDRKFHSFRMKGEAQ